MEKTSPLPALRFRLFNFLPKAVSSEPSPSTTPRPKKKKKTATIIPKRASTRLGTKNGSFRYKEPRSPKVSCIGNVKSKGKKKNNMKKKKRNDGKGKGCSEVAVASRPNSSLVLKLFRVFNKKGSKPANCDAKISSSASKNSVPKLGHMKKFSGGHGMLSGFDWRIHDSSAVSPDCPSTLSKERKEKNKDIVVVEDIVLVPRKEINLWQRRTVAPPPPLQV